MLTELSVAVVSPNTLPSNYVIVRNDGSVSFLMMAPGYAAPMSRACRRSIFARPYIWRFTSFSRVTWPSVWPLDHEVVIAARTAASSLAMPLAKEPTRLLRAISSQGGRSSLILRRIVESFDALSRLDERRQAGFDGGDRDRVGFAEMITPDRHHACDGSGRGHPLQLLVARLFGTAPAHRPFADDPQRSTEALLLQLPPECGAVPAATFPKRVEKRQVRLERALTNTEDVASAPANDLSDGPAAEARASDDLLDRHALRRQSHNGGVGVLPPQIALVLQSFSRGEKVWIDRRRADRSPYLPHRFADRVEERRLAFSIRCQRSATWVACGNAFATASL